MHKYLYLSLLFFFPLNSYSQINEDIEVESFFPIIQSCASFPGGDEELRIFVKKNLKYPEEAADNNIEGSVLVSFTVTKAGEIRDIQIIRKVDALCDAEAVRIVKSMPRWIPCCPNKTPVACSFTLPISFRLDRDEEIETY